MPDNADEKHNPSLLRIALIDTKILPHRAEVIPLEGHTVVTGGNGAGKTSLIQLMAVFYGSQPSDVVRTNERDSFIDFYLPRVSSYIGYEYRNAHGQIRSVVLHADPERRFLQYRLVRGPLDTAMFIAPDDDGGHFVQNSQLSRRLLDLDIDHERLLVTSYTDYRSIILNLPETGRREKNAVRIAALKRDFSLATRVAPLTGLETLMTQMLSNNISLGTLLSTAAMRVLDNGKTRVQILGDHKAHQMSRFPEELAGYRRVMAEEPAFRRIDALQREHEDAQTEIAERSAAVLHLQMHAEEDLSRLNARKSDRQTALDDIRDQSVADARAHKAAVADLTDKMQRDTRDRTDVLARDAALRSRGADTAAELHAKLPELRLQGESDRAALRTARSGSDDIMSDFNAQVTDHVTGTSAAKDSVRDRAAADTAAADLGAREKRAAATQRTTRLQADQMAMKDRVYAARLSLSGDISALKVAASAVTADPEMMAQDAAERARLASLHADREAAAEQCALVRDAYRDARAAATVSDAALQQAAKTRHEAQGRYDALVVSHTPAPGTLLAFLRQSDVAWAETIGRVIAPDLLNRKGLNPSWGDHRTDTLFGLSLDLDDLPILAAADMSRVEADLASAFAAVEHAQAAQKTAQDAADRDAKARSRTQRSLSEAEERLAGCAKKAARGQEAYAAFARTLGEHVAVRTAGITAKIVAKETDLADLERVVAQDEASLSAALSAARAQSMQIEDAIQARMSEIAERQAAALRAIDQAHKARMDDLLASRDDALRKKGFDTAEISRREQRLRSTQSEITKAEAAGSLAEAWGRHGKDMARVASLDEAIAQASGLMRQQDQAFAEAQRARASTEAALVTEITDVSAAILNVTDLLGSMQVMIRTLPEDVQPLENRFVTAGFEVNRDQINALMKLCKARAGEITKVLTAVTNVFRRSNNASIMEFVMSGDEGDQSVSARIAHIGSWFDDQGEVAYTLLMQGIKAVCQPIRNAYHDLREADDAIAKIGRKLGSEIRNMTTFPHVRNIDLTIGSQMKSQPFWPDLEAFDRALSDYERAESLLAGTADGEADALVAALEKLLTHWSDGSLPVVDLRQMLYIEGSITERDNLRRISRNSDLSDMSSNGNNMILRLIIFTAMLNVMRQGHDIGLVWAVDEIAALDKGNLSSLLAMLSANHISLITAAPEIKTAETGLFDYHVKLEDGGLKVFPVGQAEDEQTGLLSFQHGFDIAVSSDDRESSDALEIAAQTLIDHEDETDMEGDMA